MFRNLWKKKIKKEKFIKSESYKLMNTFKQKSLVERIKDHEKLKLSDYIPIVIWKRNNNIDNGDINRIKYMVSIELTVKHLIGYLLKKIYADNINIYHNDIILNPNIKLLEFYNMHKDSDNILYLSFC